MSAYPMTCNLKHVQRLGASTGSRHIGHEDSKGPGGPGGLCETVQPKSSFLKGSASPLPQPPNFNGLFSKIQDAFNAGLVAASMSEWANKFKYPTGEHPENFFGLQFLYYFCLYRD